MVENSFSEGSKNKIFVVKNKALLKQYAQKKQKAFGLGIIVINLLLLGTADIDELNLLDLDLEEWQEPTVHQPISYISYDSFWFKMIGLKIKKKHQIDIQDLENNTQQVFVVLIKDAAIEHFSIYTIKQGTKVKSLES